MNGLFQKDKTNVVGVKEFCYFNSTLTIQYLL